MSESEPKDPILLALGSAFSGAAFGGSTTIAGLALLRLLQAQGAPLSEDTGFWLVTAGLLAGVSCAFGMAWTLARRVPGLWRRGAVAAIAIFGSCLLAVLAAPADALGGGAGLVLYLSILLVSGIWSLVRALRAA